MSGKLAVTLKEIPVLPYEIDYLAYCKRCHTYTLKHMNCIQCKETKEISIDQLVNKQVRRRLVVRLMGLVGVLLLMIGISETLIIRLAALGWMGLCILCYLLIYKKYKEQFFNKALRNYIYEHHKEIAEDLALQFKKATKDIENSQLVAAYERLRYLAKLIDNDEVRLFKLLCVRSFDLRSDMPLEMNTLLQQECNSFLIDYIYEVSKVRKDLIDEDTLLYIIEYKDKVLMKNKGKKIIASVLEASLRSKYLLQKYAKYMPGYLQYFPKTRLLRFCKLSSCIDDEILRNGLLEEVRQVVGEDAAFEKYLSRSW